MISTIQRVSSFSSVLAYAVATALPPSPGDSQPPSRSDTPFIRTLDTLAAVEHLSTSAEPELDPCDVPLPLDDDELESVGAVSEPVVAENAEPGPNLGASACPAMTVDGQFQECQMAQPPEQLPGKEPSTSAAHNMPAEDRRLHPSRKPGPVVMRDTAVASSRIEARHDDEPVEVTTACVGTQTDSHVYRSRAIQTSPQADLPTESPSVSALSPQTQKQPASSLPDLLPSPGIVQPQKPSLSSPDSSYSILEPDSAAMAVSGDKRPGKTPPGPKPLRKKPSLPERPPPVTFSQFASRLCFGRHQRARKSSLLQRLREARVSIALSYRFLRIGSVSRKGLVESLKYGDKSSFFSIYSALYDVRAICDSASRPSSNSSSHSDESPTSTFFHRLTPRSRSDLLKILSLVRTDPDFIFGRIGSLTGPQLLSLLSPVHSVEDAASAAIPRVRPQSVFSSFNKRASRAASFKDHVMAYERTDALSALVFNAFATPVGCDSPDSALRSHVWSTVSAKLFSYHASMHYPFIGQLLSAWAATGGEWKAKPRLAIYLMDVLQSGAFLLEIPDSMKHLGFEAPDPLRTEVAEQFFHSAIRDLFAILDDSDGGFPRDVLDFSNQVISKMSVPESYRRALGYIFVNWFFKTYLYDALVYPEGHNLLLDFHISRDARERLLPQIALRAASQVSRVWHSYVHLQYHVEGDLTTSSYFFNRPRLELADPQVKKHVDNMLSHFSPFASAQPFPVFPASDSSPDAIGQLLLSAGDIVTILDFLFPRLSNNFAGSQQPSPPANSYSFRDRMNAITANQPLGRSDFVAKSPPLSPGFLTEMGFQTMYPFTPSVPSTSPVLPQTPYSRNADRIRYEIFEISDSEDRHIVCHPSTDVWELVPVLQDGQISLENGPEEQTRVPCLFSQPPHPPTSFSRDFVSEDNRLFLETAIMRLTDEFGLFEHEPFLPSSKTPDSLKNRFVAAHEFCREQCDFLGAHYWWNAIRTLQAAAPPFSTVDIDTLLLSPMLAATNHSLDSSSAVIEACEASFVALRRTTYRARVLMQDMLADLDRLRNKMWYMTDVKNSTRYEDARNVALALKTMTGPQLLASSSQQAESPPRPRHGGSRILGSSLLQKPETQVMNLIKAPSAYGDSSKLADEQVELTRAWLQRAGIDNFCQGEERIHRFCYEVKMSVNKLVGETMMETPVLWSSELYQKERSFFETSGSRINSAAGGGGSLSRSSGSRIAHLSSFASDESLYPPQLFGSHSFDRLFRPSNESLLIHKDSSQSMSSSDRWRSGGETASVGSPSKTVSSSAASESFNTFWSPANTQAQSTTSACSMSRPPSMFSDAPAPRRMDRNSLRKSGFLDGLRQTLTSLLLSDLGSPVWSCGSETDAWFTNYLNQSRILSLVEKQEQIAADLGDGLYDTNASVRAYRLRRRRSTESIPNASRKHQAGQPSLWQSSAESSSTSSFDYEDALRELMGVFSRQTNPFGKLKALADLRALLVASLSAPQQQSTYRPFSPRPHRSSFSDGATIRPEFDDSEADISDASESTAFAEWSAPSARVPSDDEIVLAMRSLIKKTQVKTLFRDLQFIAAFVPVEALKQTESGIAFLQFGFAALQLKTYVCNSMVEIADSILKDNLVRRQRLGPFGIDHSKWLWIIPAREGHPVAQRELAILYLTNPEDMPRVTLPLTPPSDTFKGEMMHRSYESSKADPQSMCLALHWMQLSAEGGDRLAANTLREREQFDSIA